MILPDPFAAHEDYDGSAERDALESRYIDIRLRLDPYDEDDCSAEYYDLRNAARAMSDDALRKGIAVLEKSVLFPH
jgi:hypothetical protein